MISVCRAPWVSIVLPVLDEGPTIAAGLQRLSCLRAVNGGDAEIIVVDGGSVDGTADTARALCDRLVVAPRGRAAQMNAGAAVARGDILLFLHADTILPPGALERVAAALARPAAAWGRFDVAIAGRHPLLPVVAAMMNLRSRLSGIATGDQAIFVRREAFHAIGGFPDIALMEDIALSARLRRRAHPCCLRQRVTTSGRRWDENGALRTILLMWRLRLAFFLGADPADLARRYGYAPRDG